MLPAVLDYKEPLLSLMQMKEHKAAAEAREQHIGLVRAQMIEDVSERLRIGEGGK